MTNIVGTIGPAHPAYAGPPPRPVCDCEDHRLGWLVLDETTRTVHDRAVHPTRAAAQRFATRAGLVVAAIAWKERS